MNQNQARKMATRLRTLEDKIEKAKIQMVGDDEFWYTLMAMHSSISQLINEFEIKYKLHDNKSNL